MMSCTMYSKRAGTSGIRGQLYETKLLSLLYIRATHDNDIEEFQLASNIDNIGAFDDICFKAKVKGFHKPLAVFIQAKLRGNEKRILNIDLATYFNSYMKIRNAFHPNNKDIFFNGTFDETECLFVIYTNANMDLSNDSLRSEFSAKLSDLIDTGGAVTTLHKYENNIEVPSIISKFYTTAAAETEHLIKIAVKAEITSLSEQIANFITGVMNPDMLLRSEHVLRYHVILAQQVFDVSEIQPDGYRMASFRNDFFDTNEEHLIVFKDTLFKEILKRRRLKHADVTLFLSEFLADPTDARRLSKLIGTVIMYNNGQLEFNKKTLKDFRPDMMRRMDVSRSTVDEAVELAAREMLTFQKLKVPAAFGNKDLTIRGSGSKIEKRIEYLAWRIIEYMHGSNNIVTIDDSLGYGFLQLNGGIAGAIGNIFVLDDDTKLMKITDNWESLGTYAKKLYTKLIDKIHDLHKYKFCFKADRSGQFPKLTFGEYEENLVRDFLNKLLIYYNQADENVEEKIKMAIEDYQLNQPNYFQVKTDAIFLKYHDAIQQWWMHPSRSHILTRESHVFQNSVATADQGSLMKSINETFMSKIKNNNYTFTEDAVRSLNLRDQHSSTVIVAENSVLTIVKVMQHLKNSGFVVLDLEYIANLPTNDQNALRYELKFTHEEKVRILICDKIDFKNEKSLADIAKAGPYKRIIIIITNQKTLQIINRYFPETDEILHDKKLSLSDLSKESQRILFETATAIFPGGEIKLNHLLRGWPKTGYK